jgi:hypothetical protein
MKYRKGFVAALFSLLVAASARGSDRLSVGDASVSGAHLKPYKNLWTFSQQKPGGSPAAAGTWSDSLEPTTFEGRPALKRTQVVKYLKGIQITFANVFDPKTMEPFTADYTRSDNGDVRHIDFHRETVTFRETTSKDARTEEKTAKLDCPVYDFYDGMYGVLISALPLKEGYESEIPAFDAGTMAVDWVPVRVVGRETVEAGPGKAAATWVVETTPKLYGKMTWWVTRDAPYVIKAALEVLKNENGSKEVAAVITFTMV